MGGVFNILNGFGAFRSEEVMAQVGIIQVLLNFLLGGLAVMLLTRFVPKPGETKGLLKYAGDTLVIIVGWVMSIALIVTLLQANNIILRSKLLMVTKLFFILISLNSSLMKSDCQSTPVRASLSALPFWW